ncbi:MAG: hypothetical protein HPY69_11060 [Armatimonadetes bacterium]|nr:hypothetical protein [Armatimonadota bacterium]
MSFAEHNAEQAAVWKAFWEGKPTRVPMILGVSSRYTVLNPEANPEGYDFEDFFCRPEAMYRHLLRKQHFIRHHLWCDQEMGLPDKWQVAVDFQNSYEALWFGCPIHFREGQVPDTTPILGDDNKRMLFDRGLPDPFPATGWMARAWEYYEQFKAWAADDEFEGRPIEVTGVPGVGTDGVFTTACALRDPTRLMLDIYEDPGYIHELMAFLTEAFIRRIRAYRERLGQPVESTAFGLADDAIQMLSVEHYREFVLPYHKRLVAEFGSQGPNSMHLCGDATRHFRTIRDELNVMSFDTGFPVDFGWLRQELGPEVTIYGGVHVEVLRRGPAEAIVAEVRRILSSGIMEGGKFVLRDANNLAPYTPPEHVRVMYETVKEYGRYA